jgi:hypothetical protein
MPSESGPLSDAAAIWVALAAFGIVGFARRDLRG